MLNLQTKDETIGKNTSDLLMQKLVKEKNIAFEFQKRRHPEWTDNYELYRNKIRTNRLTQRQAVGIPLMKETIKTLLSDVDEIPNLIFRELGGDKQKELILQERWNDDADRLNFEGIDAQDKKTVLLYGRGFKKLNFVNGDINIDNLDIYDVLVDPLVNPLNLETARFVIHQNIFRSVREVLADKRYTGSGKTKLKEYLTSKEGFIQSEENKKLWEAKVERLKSMGVEDKDFPLFPAGDILLNLSEHFTWLWDKKAKKFVRYVVVYANNKVRLLKDSLKNLIGVEFLPLITWGEDIETQDVWNDGPADLVRTPNKILNVFFSQMIENRTLRNFFMHWYDSTIQGYQPQTYTPGPGRMLPAPGDPNKVIKAVEVSGLEDCLTMIDFLIKLVERGTSATAMKKGVSEKKQITLGEVEMLLGEAKKQAMTMSKFYRRAHKELGMKYWQILEANDGKMRTLYKTSSKGNIWPKKVWPKDWKSKAGYRVEDKSNSEKEAEDIKGIQKWTYIKNAFPDNPVVARIAQRKTLEIGDITPEEQREIEEFEKKKAEMPSAVPAGPNPEEQKLAQSIKQGTNELANLTARV